MRSICRWLVCILMLTSSCAGASEIVLYAYHLKPPYITGTDHQSGLYQDLASLLSERITGHTFKMVYLPRRRLEYDLEQGRLPGLVIGVNPAWFKGAAATSYLWTPAFMNDEDVVVSRADAPIVYREPASLIGKRVGLAAGYYYFGIDELVREGRIRRDDAISEDVSLDKLLRKRVDAVVVTRRTLAVLLQQQPDWRKQIHVSSTPHDRFERMILVPQAYAYLLPELTRAISQIRQDPNWARAISSSLW